MSTERTGIRWLVLLILGSMIFSAAGCKPLFKKGARLEGGMLNLHTSQFPESFNAFVNNSADASEVFGLVYDSLLELDENTLNYRPLIARSWTVSPDKKEFIFKLDPRAKWSDGKPITASDVRFTYDVIMNPKNLTSVMRLYLSRLNPPEIIDTHTVKFTTKTVHFKNFEAVAELNILPQHLYQGKDFNKDFTMNLPGSSGPYFLSEVKEGRYYVLTRRKDYWADRLPYHKRTYNFAKIKYKVMARDVAFEAFKRGDFDIYDEITPERWVKESNSEPFVKHWIVKQKIFNDAPRGFSGMALNLRRPIFQDLKVRQALAYLFDRKTIVKKIMYNESQPINSYWPGYLKNSNPGLEYNPDMAKRLLGEAGFNRLDQDGTLRNASGVRMEFSIYYLSDDQEKYLTLFKESCRQAGVNVKLSRTSWATLIKQMDEYKFDAVLIAWTGALFPDPEQLWHSRHASEIGGSNLPGYKNPEVDRLIDTLPPVFDPQERMAVIQKMDGIIWRDMPYLLFWQPDHTKLFYKNIFGMPKTVFQKYSNSIIKYWWYDPKKVAAYKQAVAKHGVLPAKPLEIHYDSNQEAKP